MSFLPCTLCNLENSSLWGRPTRSSCHNHAMIVGDGRGSKQDKEFNIEVNKPCLMKVQVLRFCGEDYLKTKPYGEFSFRY